MQLPEDCFCACSPPPPLFSLSPLSLALCLAGFSPGLAQSRNGPVDTFCSTTSDTFCRNAWAWTSWAWTCTTAVVSSKKSTSMSGWVFKSGGELVARSSQQVVIMCFCRAHLPKVSQLLRSSTTISNVMLLAPLTFLLSINITGTQHGTRLIISKQIKTGEMFCLLLYVFVYIWLWTGRREVWNHTLDFLESPSLSLLIQAVNELLESLGAPLEIVDGFVSSISVTIPWQALLTDHCTLEVLGLQITCRPKYRTSEFPGRLFGSTFWNPTHRHTYYDVTGYLH